MVILVDELSTGGLAVYRPPTRRRTLGRTARHARRPLRDDRVVTEDRWMMGQQTGGPAATCSGETGLHTGPAGTTITARLPAEITMNTVHADFTAAYLTANDNYTWICPPCFNDFHEQVQWQVIPASTVGARMLENPVRTTHSTRRAHPAHQRQSKSGKLIPRSRKNCGGHLTRVVPSPTFTEYEQENHAGGVGEASSFRRSRRIATLRLLTACCVRQTSAAMVISVSPAQ